MITPGPTWMFDRILARSAALPVKTADPSETEIVFRYCVHFAESTAVPSKWSKNMYTASPSLVVVAVGFP